jgi:hypothetical protein
VTAAVQFGSLMMTGTTPATDGTYIVGSEFFSDWYTVPDSKVPPRERPTADGAYGIDHDWRTGLPLRMTGRFRGGSWPSMLAALQAIAFAGAQVTVTVTDAAGSSSRSVSIRRFVPRPNAGARICFFDMDLFAVDPRRYGSPLSPSTGLPTTGTGQAWPQVWPANWGTGGNPGRVTLTNTGGAPTSPLLMVAGGLADGVQLVETTTGAYLQLDRIIPAGSVAYFNTRTSRVYLDDPANDIGGFTSRREWAGFQVPAGGTRIIQFNGLGIATGTPTLTAQYSPAN